MQNNKILINMLTGNDLKFEIWKDADDYKNWDKYLEYIKAEPSFSEIQKNKLVEIYKFFRRELQEDYISKCNRDGRNLVNSWITSRGERYTELIWLYNTLKYFKSKRIGSNYDKVLSHLRKNKSCNEEGVPFLFIGDSLRKARLDIIFEPKTSFKRNPDLQIVNKETGEVIFGEVSKMRESEENEKKSFTYYYSFDFFHFTPPNLHCSGRILRSASKEELNEVKPYIIALKQKAYTENLFLISSIEKTNGIFEFGTAHPDKQGELENWRKQKGFLRINEVQSQPLDLDYTPRLLKKIIKEARQIPQSTPGILYFPLPPLFYHWGITDHAKLVNEIQITLKGLNNIAGVLLYVQIDMPLEDSKLFFEGNYFQRKRVHNDHFFDVLFVINLESSFQMSNNTIEKLYRSFELFFE